MTDKAIAQILKTIAYEAPISGNHLAQARVLMAAKMYADKPAQPDCRTCANMLMCQYKQFPTVCTNGDKYQPAPPVVLWRME